MQELKKIRILILEVTRRCNMCCAHCLRGEAQNMDMTKELLDKIFDNVLNTVDYIGQVVFAGGEPTLNIPAIRYFFEKAEQAEKLPASFYIATNGKEHQEELAIELLKMYPKMDEKDMCGVSLSIDEFHERNSEDPRKVNSILRGLAFYTGDKEESEHSRRYLIKEGRAIEYSEMDENYKFRDPLPLDIESDDGAVEMLYISANGNIVGDCDASFEHIDQAAKYNVDHFTGLEDEE